MNGKLLFKKTFGLNTILKYNVSIWSPLAEAFNAIPIQKFDFKKQDVGLFNIPELVTHDGFYKLKDLCAAKTDSLVNEALNKSRNRKMVEIFDEMSDSLCQIADLAEFIRMAHPESKYRDTAVIVSCAVSGIVEKLNTNVNLYKALKDSLINGDIKSTTAVDKYVGELFIFDFEQCGIHLSERERNRVVILNDDILHLGQQFVARTGIPRILKKSSLPDKIKDIFASDGNEVVVSGIYIHSSNPLAREMVYKIFLRPDPHQLFLLNELLLSRNELAKICDFPTYAHRALRGAIFENPNNVMTFLQKLSTDNWKKAEDDFEYMNRMKAKVNPGSSFLGVWDVPYFVQKAKECLFNISSKELLPYFSLGACMDGLNILFQSLFGIQLVNTNMELGECWHSDVYKLSVIHETEGLLGYIYCDFYERSYKPNQDCHLTIKGGRCLPDQSYQIPIVVLILNIPVPRWSSPSLLNPNMVDNLFHEMGHAMHSMLARTQYQHISGTRCSTDFAEVPSILMEYFASDHRVLKKFARHFQTNEVIPDDMLYRLCASKHLFTASETQLRTFYAAIDQVYHGEHPLKGSTTEVLEETQKNYYALPYAENTAWQLRFCHLVGYGAKYYSYLVSRALAYSIWHTYFQKDPFSRENGEKFRRNCLAYGGGKNPKQLISDFLHMDPNPEILAECLNNEIDFHRAQVKDIMTTG